MIWTAVLVLASAVITWLSYGNERLWGLMALRFAAMALIIWLIADPILTWHQTRTDKPEWVVLVDGSQSVETSASQIIDHLKRLRGIDTTHVSVRFTVFDDSVRTLVTDSYTSRGSSTNLHAAFRFAYSSSPRLRGIVLISDGLFTRGRDPLSDATEAGIPVHVLPVGRANRVTDVAVLDALFPERAPRNVVMDVPVRFAAIGLEGDPVRIRLFENGREIDQADWTPLSDSDYHSHVFRIATGEPGLVRYEIRVDDKPEEASMVNNRFRAIVRIDPDRIRVIHAVYELHPDVGAFRTILGLESSFELTPVWMKPVQADSADVLIIHGWPSGEVERQSLESATRRVPHLIAPLPATWSNPDLRTVHAPGRVVEKLVTNVRSGTHPVTDLPSIAVDRAPYLFGPPSVAGGFDPLLTSPDGSTVLRIRSGQTPRSAVLDAWGWHRWWVSPTKAEREWTLRFVQQLVKWLGTEETDELLRLEGLPETLSEQEPLRLTARLRNSSGQPQAGADLTVRISDRLFRMRPEGAGLYVLDLPPYPEGTYEMRITAEVGGQQLARQDRSFDVGPSPEEFRTLQRNDELLSALAQRTGGTFDDPDAVATILESTRTETNRKALQFPVRRHWFWFVLAIGLLTAEWVWRRRLFKP